MKINANLIKSGNILKHKDKLLNVLSTSIIKPGKGGAFIQVEMKDIKTGNKTNERWRTSEYVEKVAVNEIIVSFLFAENESITVMDNQNYEQFSIKNELLGNSVRLLEEGMQLNIEKVDEEIVNIKLPKNLKVEIQTADAVVKGQTASSSFKTAITTKDIKVLVPQHIKEGDKILVNSETLEYVEKAKD